MPKRKRSSNSDPPSDEESASEESELEVVLDANGRISGTSNLNLNFDFVSCNNSTFLPYKNYKGVHAAGKSDDMKPVARINALDVLLRDVEAIFDGCTTFWMPARGHKPRCTFERLAKKIFDFHTRNLTAADRATIDWNKTGAEYWTQRRCLTNTSASAADSTLSDSVMLRNDDSMIRFHWDKDEEMVDETDGAVTIFPLISTVTYLTEGGSPTLIFPQVHSQINASHNEDSSDCEGSEEVFEDTALLEYAYASYPKLGKHVSFDGRFLHGCPSSLSVCCPPDGGIRATFLVNIWINWKPLGPEVFPDEHLHLLSNITDDIFEFNFDKASLITKAKSSANAKAIPNTYHSSNLCIDEVCHYSAYFGPNAWDKKLMFYWPSISKVQQLITNNHMTSFCMRFPDTTYASVIDSNQIHIKKAPILNLNGTGAIETVASNYAQHKMLLLKGGVSVDADVDYYSLLAGLYERFSDDMQSRFTLIEGNKKKLTLDNIILSLPRKEVKIDSKMKFRNNENYKGSGSKGDDSTWLAVLDIFQTDASVLYEAICNEFHLQTICASFTKSLPLVGRVSLYVGHNYKPCKKTNGSGKALGVGSEILPGNTHTAIIQLCGHTEWKVQPDVSKDWSDFPPPIIDTTEQTLNISLVAGDILLINRNLWQYAISKSPPAVQTSRGKIKVRDMLETCPQGHSVTAAIEW